MLSVFGDESHDARHAHVFAVGVLLGDTDTWQLLRKRWMERTDGLIFHAADCESGYGDFSDMDEVARQRLYRDLTRVLAESRLLGIGFAVDLYGSRKHFAETVTRFPDMPFYNCFFHAVLKSCDIARHFVPPDRLEFTFDQHRETEYNAGLLYEWLSENRPIAAEKISFGTRREPGIQAADLWARELMKRSASLLSGGSTTARWQWRTLKDTLRFKAELHTEKYFAAMRHQEDEVLQRSGYNETDYQKWRSARRLVDNLSNRFTYFTTLESGPLGLFREAPGAIIEL